MSSVHYQMTISFYCCFNFVCLEMFILLSFWFFIVLRNFIFQIIIIDVLLMATYLITGFYVNSEGSSYNFFSQMPVDIVQQRGKIGTFNNRIKIYFYKGPFCLLSALIYAFLWSCLFGTFSMVRFTVNSIRFAINSRLFLPPITRIYRKVRTVNYITIVSRDCKRYVMVFFSVYQSLVVMQNSIQDLSLTLVKAFQFATGTSIACQLITTLKYIY